MLAPCNKHTFLALLDIMDLCHELVHGCNDLHQIQIHHIICMFLKSISETVKWTLLSSYKNKDQMWRKWKCNINGNANEMKIKKKYRKNENMPLQIHENDGKWNKLQMIFY